MQHQPTTPTRLGVVINGTHYLARTDVMQLYKLSNNKSHRLLSATTSLPWIYVYDRRFYAYDEVTAYLNDILIK